MIGMWKQISEAVIYDEKYRLTAIVGAVILLCWLLLPQNKSSQVCCTDTGILICVRLKQLTVSRLYQTSERAGTRIERDCKPPKIWPYKWPFALDMLFKIIKGDREMRLLSLIKECFDITGNTFEQQLLGGRGFVTIDPKNVEAILSNNFDGKQD